MMRFRIPLTLAAVATASVLSGPASAESQNTQIAAYPFFLEHVACVRDPSEPDITLRIEHCSAKKEELEQRLEAILPAYVSGPDRLNGLNSFRQELFDIDKRARLFAKHGKSFTPEFVVFMRCLSSAILQQEGFVEGHGFRGQTALKSCKAEKEAVLADRSRAARESRDAVNGFNSLGNFSPSFAIMGS